MSCSGECCVCKCGGGCIAGHGDDFFIPATKEQIIDNLNEGKYPRYYDYMVAYLKNVFGFEYKGPKHKIFFCEQNESAFPIKPMQRQLLSEKDIKSVEAVLEKGDRVELIPVKDGVKVIRVKREEVKANENNRSMASTS